jgi:hypothetical protein
MNHLKEFNKNEQTIYKDWLIEKPNAKPEIYKSGKNLIISNGLVSRTFTTSPNMSTISLNLLTNNQEFIRSVRAEAELEIDGIKLKVGGLQGQPIHNYLLPEWVNNMESASNSFKYIDFEVKNNSKRFDWKKRLKWMPKDMPWPVPGKEFIFRYKLEEETIKKLNSQYSDEATRDLLISENFSNENKSWETKISNSDPRNSFINEGKFGEIMALQNSAVFAEFDAPLKAESFIVKLNAGTDKSATWGAGIALVTNKGNIKLNVRPGEKKFGFYNGAQEILTNGYQSGKSVYLKLTQTNGKIKAFYSYNSKNWETITDSKIENFKIQKIRIGKTDRSGNFSDFNNKGKRIRCRIEEFKAYSKIKSNKITNHKLDYLKSLEVKVHYVLYDNMPVISKWISIHNNSNKEITINKFTSEILALYETESVVDSKKNWALPQIGFETDYNFGGMSDESIYNASLSWESDPFYHTQVNYQKQTKCLLKAAPKLGPEQTIKPGESFRSFRVWELIHDSMNRERRGLEYRRMMRALAPWLTENPILMHVKSAKNEAVKKAIDQCAEVGFEKVIMTFGSGFNAENDSKENLERMKNLADYAHSKGITLGGYSLLASRRINKENDVVMPKGKRPRFGNSPCIESKWGQNYFKKLYKLYEYTGLDNFEHDGSYPGDVCASTNHPGHKGLGDSQWNQYKTITDFYKWCRSKGIYLNVPDYYFLSGSNKTGMGYRETNWSLPRAQQEIVERQNIYDGTWKKTPSMGWMFVPLVQYHGGGAEATIEPLKEHLPHYEQRLANLFGAGVQACYRGPQLYDSPETKALVKKWVNFYKENREILDADIIHIRRPDGRDYDAIMHVNPFGKTKALVMIYNPLNEKIKRKIKLNLYYTGIKNKAKTINANGKEEYIKILPNGDCFIEIEIAPRSQTYIKLY